MTPEGRVQDDVECSASSFSCKLLRNNVGSLKNDLDVWVRYGLGNISKKLNKRLKSSDLVGWTTITITPEMVGRKVAVFTAIEVKPPSFKVTGVYKEDSRECAQERFCNLVREGGGFGAIVNSDQHFKTTMKFFIESMEITP